MTPTNSNNNKRPYSCPKCNRPIVLLTEFYGWERESVDGKTGDAQKVVSAERTSVQAQALECSNHPACDWGAPYFEDEENEDEE